MRDGLGNSGHFSVVLLFSPIPHLSISFYIFPLSLSFLLVSVFLYKGTQSDGENGPGAAGEEVQ